MPLKKGQKVVIFGKAQIDYVKGGGGSGDVSVSYVRNIYEGLKLKEGKIEVLDIPSLFYTNYVKSQYKAGNEKGCLEELELPESILNAAIAFTDTAIVTINRYSKEGFDRKNDECDTYYSLSDNEKKLINDVCDNFAHVIVLLNVGAIIDT